MKRIFLTGLFASLIAVACFAQKPYKVVFYNFENLFDTIHDPGVLDEEFTPEGPKKWNSAKYTRKIGNLERVLFDIAAEDKDYPVVIGVSEIENRSVMEDVIAQPKLAPGNYRIVHYDSPDARGVDVAFYYRPDVFKLEGSAAIPFKMPELPNFRTRDFVTMWGTIDSEPFFFLVSHWPSRLGGKEASAPKRLAAAKQVKHIVDSVTAANPATKVVVMGDLNDDATDDSIVEGLNAKGKIKEVGKDGFTQLASYGQINLVKAVQEMGLATPDGWFNVNYNFLGLDLTATPWEFIKNFTFTWAVIGVILIPILAGLSQFVFSKLTMKTQPQTDAAGGASMKSMMYMMPLMSVYIAFIMPAALGVYWIAQSVFSLIQEVTLNKYFNKILDREETEKEKAAREKRYAKYQKQKELMAQQQMNGGGRNDRKPQPKKKKQGGEEKRSGTNENGRVGQRPYARGRAYDEKHYE